MTKKQVVLVSLVTAVPAAGLLAVLILAALNHQNGVFGGLMWLFWGLVLLGAAIVAVMPLLIGLFYPAQGFAAAAAGAAAAPLLPDGGAASSASVEDEFDDSESLEDSLEDDGEPLFEDAEMDDELDDFEDEFEDDEF